MGRQTLGHQVDGDVVAVVLALLWTLPTFGLALSSFRPEQQIKTTGWWTFFSHPKLTLLSLPCSQMSLSQLVSNFL